MKEFKPFGFIQTDQGRIDVTQEQLYEFKKLMVSGIDDLENVLRHKADFYQAINASTGYHAEKA
jgi:hypothetical protein